MNFIKQIERLQLLNKLIEEERTQAPEDLANRLGVSRRQLYNYIENLKDIGLEVVFSRKHNSFCYPTQKKLEISFHFKILEEDNVTKINGGFFSKSFFRAFFLHGAGVI